MVTLVVRGSFALVWLTLQTPQIKSLLQSKNSKFEEDSTYSILYIQTLEHIKNGKN